MAKNNQKQLSAFVKSVDEFINFNIGTIKKLESNPKLKPYFAQPVPGEINDENPHLKNVDAQTRAELRAALLMFQFSSNMTQLIDKKTHIEPNQIIRVINDLEGLVDHYLDDSYKERTKMNFVVDFFKACANFLITLVTFGASQSFFDTTVGRLEKVKAQHQTIKSIHSKLTAAEQEMQLQRDDITQLMI